MHGHLNIKQQDVNIVMCNAYNMKTNDTACPYIIKRYSKHPILCDIYDYHDNDWYD